MKRLIIKKITVVSQKNEEARVINFDEKLTVITGDNQQGNTINRTGKSLMMKSIYYAMGAKLKKYTTNWKELNICTIIVFSYNNSTYELYRNGEYFVLYDGIDFKFFSTIGALKEFYADFFEFYIKMPVKSGDENSVYAYPGAIFMPFYIDQDMGWNGLWGSFSDVFSVKWKEEILLYHMGIRTKKYYELAIEKLELDGKKKENKKELKTYEVISANHTEKYKKYLDINIDIEKFEDDILILTNELNAQLKKKNEIKNILVSSFNEMKELEEFYIASDITYRNLLDDVEYVERELLEREIICPICGTTHENEIENKFYIYTEIEECEQAIQEYFQKKSRIEERIKKQSQELDKLDIYIKSIKEILDKNREQVTFREVIVAEGAKAILSDIQKEENRLCSEYLDIESRIRNITKEQSKITRDGKEITKKYLKRLKIALTKLNVVDIDEKDLKKFKCSFSSGGNDLPCAILSQVYTIYTMAVENSKTVCGPIILDAIFQQEPSKGKINIIWDYLLKEQPLNSQMILSTTEIYDKKFKGKVISFTKEKGVLQQEDYLMEKEKINEYKKILLKELEKCEF